MNIKKNITGIILAGGKSSRMRTEKGLVLLDGKPFVQLIIEALEPLVDELIIVSSNVVYDTFNIKRVEDIITDSGPIAGLHSGLTHSKTKNNLVLSCDVPLLRTSLLKKLIAHKEDDYDIIQFEAKGKTIPLIALYQKRCKEKCLELLNNDERRLRKLVSQLHVKTIPVLHEEYDQVRNMNTIKDLKEITNAIDH